MTRRRKPQREGERGVGGRGGGGGEEQTRVRGNTSNSPHGCSSTQERESERKSHFFCSLLGEKGHLSGTERRVDAILCQELRVGADLGDASVRDDGDAIGVLDGGEAVSDDNGGVLVDLVKAIESLLHHLRVEEPQQRTFERRKQRERGVTREE